MPDQASRSFRAGLGGVRAELRHFRLRRIDDPGLEEIHVFLGGGSKPKLPSEVRLRSTTTPSAIAASASIACAFNQEGNFRARCDWAEER